MPGQTTTTTTSNISKHVLHKALFHKRRFTLFWLVYDSSLKRKKCYRGSLICRLKDFNVKLQGKRINQRQNNFKLAHWRLCAVKEISQNVMSFMLSILNTVEVLMTDTDSLFWHMNSLQ